MAVTLDPRGRRVLKVKLGRVVCKDPKVWLEMLAQRGRVALLGISVRKDQRALLDLKDQKATQVHKVQSA